MPTSVLLVSAGPFGSWWRESILHREGIEVHEEPDYDSAYRELVMRSHPAFILEHKPADDQMPMFLWRVRTSGWPVLPKGLLITSSADPSLRKLPVAQVLSPPVHPDLFDRVAAELLGLRPRGEARRHVNLAVEGETRGRKRIDGTAVDLCTGGMLVRSEHAIPLGERVRWVFQEPPSLRGLTLPGTVLRPAGPERPLGHHYYAVRFDGTQGAWAERLARYVAGRRG